jgi:hypothetical protein
VVAVPGILVRLPSGEWRALLEGNRSSTADHGPDADTSGRSQSVEQAVAAGVDAAAASQASAQATLAEAQSRRRNLLIPLGLIATLMVLLALKLRQLEGRGRRTDG